MDETGTRTNLVFGRDANTPGSPAVVPAQRRLAPPVAAAPSAAEEATVAKDQPPASSIHWRVKRRTCSRWCRAEGSKDDVSYTLRRGLCRTFLLSICKQHALKYYKKSALRAAASSRQTALEVVSADVHYADAELMEAVRRVCRSPQKATRNGHDRSERCAAAPELEVTSVVSVFQPSGGPTAGVTFLRVVASLRERHPPGLPGCTTELAVCVCDIRMKPFPSSHL